jgi:hypothetical protein
MAPAKGGALSTRCYTRAVRSPGYLVACLGWLASGTPSAAHPASPGYTTSFVPLKDGVQGILYQPATPNPKSQVGIVVMHTSAS